MTVLSMTITYRKEMKTLDPIEVRCKDETVLVLFVRIAWDESYCGGKSKFGNNIVPSRVFLDCFWIVLTRFRALLGGLFSRGSATIRWLSNLMIILVDKRWGLLHRVTWTLGTIPSILGNGRIIMGKETLLLNHWAFQDIWSNPSSGDRLLIMDWTHGLGRVYWGNLSVIC